MNQEEEKLGITKDVVASSHDSPTVEHGAPSEAEENETRIVVGVDGSDASISALRRGVRIASALNASLEAVTVWHYPITFAGYAASGWSPEADAKDVLAGAIETVFGKNPSGWFHPTIREGSPAQVLIAESEGAEMLIVGSRGHGGFVGLLLGSVSSACAEHAHCPVLVIHNADSDGNAVSAEQPPPPGA